MDLFQWLRGAYGGEPELVVPEGPPTPPVRRRYRFSGLVQGVGFRYEAKILASRLNLTGWVRNESDGSVSLEAEGEARVLNAFVRAIQAVPRFEITDIETEELPVSGRERGFQVRY